MTALRNLEVIAHVYACVCMFFVRTWVCPAVCACVSMCVILFSLCVCVYTSIHGHKCTLFAHLFTCVSFSVLSDSQLWFPIISRLAWVPNGGYINWCVLSMQIDYVEVADDGNGTDDAHKVHTQIPKHRLHCKGPCSLLQLCAIFQGSKTFQE
jgi:Mg2+/citrate symporter